MRLLDWSFGDPDFKGALWMVLSPGPVPHSHMDIRGQDPGVLLHGMQTLGRTPCWRDTPKAVIPNGHFPLVSPFPLQDCRNHSSILLGTSHSLSSYM